MKIDKTANDVKLRQICLFYAFMSPVSKMIIAPAYIAYHAKNNLIFSAAALILLQAAVIAVVMLTTSKHADATFFDMLSNTFGKITAKILFGALAAAMLLLSLLPLLEQKYFVARVFYGNSYAPVLMLAFFAFSLYFAAKGFKATGRMSDALTPVFIVSYAAIVLLALFEANFSYLPPINAVSASQTLRASGFAAAWFCDSAFLLLFLGHFKREKYSTLKVTGSYLAGGAFTLLFMATFYAVYGILAADKYNALGIVSRYAVGLSTIGRVDFIPIFAMSVILVYYTAVPIQASAYCVREIIGRQRCALSSVIANALPLIFLISVGLSFSKTGIAMCEKLFPLYLTITFIVPLLVVVLRKTQKGATHPFD